MNAYTVWLVLNVSIHTICFCLLKHHLIGLKQVQVCLYLAKPTAHPQACVQLPLCTTCRCGQEPGAGWRRVELVYPGGAARQQGHCYWGHLSKAAGAADWVGRGNGSRPLGYPGEEQHWGQHSKLKVWIILFKAVYFHTGLFSSLWILNPWGLHLGAGATQGSLTRFQEFPSKIRNRSVSL